MFFLRWRRMWRPVNLIAKSGVDVFRHFLMRQFSIAGSVISRHIGCSRKIPDYDLAVVVVSPRTKSLCVSVESRDAE